MARQGQSGAVVEREREAARRSAGSGGWGGSGRRRFGLALWVTGIAGFAALHGVHLRADFPNHSPWMFDWAKFTDEGWYGNAAVRARLFGQWYVAGDFNPAVAVPVWPALEWVVFGWTGVTVQAARALAVGIFWINLALSYALLRAGAGHGTGRGSGTRWVALLGISLLVTSPFLYCFSRLAILEPLLTALVLAGLNVAVRLGGWKRPEWGAAGVGALAVVAALTKTTAIFLLPALAVAMAAVLWPRRGLALKCLAAAGAVFAGGYGLWLTIIARAGLWADYKYYFFVNDYPRPHEWWWPLASLWWSAHGLLWVDWILAPLAAVLVVGAAGAVALSPVPKSEGPGAPGLRANAAGPSTRRLRRLAQDDRKVYLGRNVPTLAAKTRTPRGWGTHLLLDPVAGASVIGTAGMILFMTVQNHPQPRYFAPVAFFVVFLLVRALEVLGPQGSGQRGREAEAGALFPRGWAGAALAVMLAAMGWNGVRTVRYAMHPEYTFVTAAANLTHYIDTHPNGNRLLVSISGDQITLLTHLPSLCDDFGTMDLPQKIGIYKPGWYAAWNDFDPGTLEDLHTHYSVEQVAEFPALDDPQRNVLVLFKLHPLPNGEVREPHDEGMPDLTQPLPEDKIDVEME